MRFNKAELVTLASHSEHKFHKQGILTLREKQESFFHRHDKEKKVESDDDDENRRGSFRSLRNGAKSKAKSNTKARSSFSCIGPIHQQVISERWFRLCGNLLFYLRTCDQWSEPAGVIVLENCTVRLANNGKTTTNQSHSSVDTTANQSEVYYLSIEYISGGCQLLGASTETDCASWIEALTNASFTVLRNRLAALKQEIHNQIGLRGGSSAWRPPVNSAPVKQKASAGKAAIAKATPTTTWFDKEVEEEVDIVDMELQPQNPQVRQSSQLIKQCGYVSDISEAPICEIGLACDNLVCDSHGRPPNPKCVVYLRNTTNFTSPWIKYACTELVQKSSNPTFLRTIYLRASDGLISDSTEVKFTVYDVRERVTGVQLIIGQLIIRLELLRTVDRLRLPLSLTSATEGAAATAAPYIHGGNITITIWNIEKQDACSTESTPCRLLERSPAGAGGVVSSSERSRLDPQLNTTQGDLANKRNSTAASTSTPTAKFYTNTATDTLKPPTNPSELQGPPTTPPNASDESQPLQSYTHHRRTQSLPPKLAVKPLQLPLQSNFRLFFSNTYMQTYRFHSGLGGDIFVHEIMAESRFSFTFPQQLLTIWIAEEKELLQEMIGLGELRQPYQQRQLDILEQHLMLISQYTQAKHQLSMHSGHGNSIINAPAAADFKPSQTKGSSQYEFVPLNLHLQRIWAQNESLHKNGFHDVITVGAFTAFARGFKEGGLAKLMQNWKDFGDTTTTLNRKRGQVNQSQSAWYVTNKVNMTFDSVQGIKRLRKEIVERMQLMTKLAKERKIFGLHKYVEDIYHRCRLLLSICDQSLIEEAFDFIEQNKLTIPNSVSLDFGQTTPETLNTPEIPETDEGIALESPNSPLRSVVEMFKKRQQKQQRNNNSQSETSTTNSNQSEERTPDSGIDLDEMVKCFLDSPSTNYYRPTEEPEPWDLTILNVEASIISLNSKIKAICGTSAYIQPHSLRPANYYQSLARNSASAAAVAQENWRSYPPVGNLASAGAATQENWISAPQQLLSLSEEEEGQPASAAGKTTHEEKAASGEEEGRDLADWSEELRSSTKKLRLAMDGILKTSRLAHCIFRLQENMEKANLANVIKFRRDVCFSQALTSLVCGLMTKLWCQNPDPTFLHVLTKLGPLACFHGLLSYYSNEAEMFNDMCVAIEDLRNVEFVLVLASTTHTAPSSASASCFPQQPKVAGNRCALKVFLPIPQNLLHILPAETGYAAAAAASAVVVNINNGQQQPSCRRRSRCNSFVVTPVFFNIGINEKATLAERLGNVEPQNKQNQQSFERLKEYYRKYKKLTLAYANAPVKPKTRNGGLMSGSTDDRLLDNLFEELRIELGINNTDKQNGNNKKGSSRTHLPLKKKNVEILHISNQICGLLMGLRFTSCKSAKDRTGMAVTLEQTQILSQEYDLAEHEFKLALDAMRSEGCRRENALKNCGSRKYNFNSMQVFSLPKLYQPPNGSFGGGTAAME